MNTTGTVENVWLEVRINEGWVVNFSKYNLQEEKDFDEIREDESDDDAGVEADTMTTLHGDVSLQLDQVILNHKKFVF